MLRSPAIGWNKGRGLKMVPTQIVNRQNTPFVHFVVARTNAFLQEVCKRCDQNIRVGFQEKLLPGSGYKVVMRFRYKAQLKILRKYIGLLFSECRTIAVKTIFLYVTINPYYIEFT